MRQSPRVIVAACACFLLSLGTAWAQRSLAEAGPAGTDVSKPFLRLFSPKGTPAPQAGSRLEVQLDAARRTLDDVQSGSTRRFICGMPVLEADPGIDPTSIVRPPETGIRFAIRTAPPTCR